MIRDSNVAEQTGAVASNAASNAAWFEIFFGFSETRLTLLNKEVKMLLEQCGTEIIGPGKKNISYHVSSKLIKKNAFKAGAMGSATSIPATIPVLGTIGTAVFGISADISYLIRTQVELCYAIAFAYQAKIDSEELKAVVLALIGFSSTREIVREIAATTVKNSINGAARKHMVIGLEKASLDIGEKISTRIIRKSYKLLPFISMPVSAAINIAAVMMVGNQARKYFLACDDRL